MSEADYMDECGQVDHYEWRRKREHKMTDEFDVDLPQDESKLVTLKAKAQEALALMEYIEQLTQDLNAANSALHVLRSKEIPTIMAELNIDPFTHGGKTFELEEKLSGSLPKDPEKREKALEAIKEYDGEGIIKNQITAEFGKGEHNQALAAVEDLKKQGFDAKSEESIHPQTYLAFARERLKNGETIDLERLGIFSIKIAKIKDAKK